MIRSLNWANLQAFLVLSREGRLTVAARRAGIDHATLKRRISDLEDDLGIILFERTPSGYVLTQAGGKVSAVIEEMESASLKLGGKSLGLKSMIEGAIRIASPDVFGQRFLAPRLGALSDAYPALELQLVATPRSIDLTKREIDVAITGDRPQQGRLHARKLTDYELGLYATQAYIDRAPPIKSCSDLGCHRLIGFIDDLTLESDMNYLVSINPTLKPKIGITSAGPQISVVLADAGVAVLPCWAADEEQRLVRVLPNDIRMFRSLWLSCNSDMRDVGAVRAVCDFISDQIKASKKRFLPLGDVREPKGLPAPTSTNSHRRGAGNAAQSPRPHRKLVANVSK